MFLILYFNCLLFLTLDRKHLKHKYTTREKINQNTRKNQIVQLSNLSSEKALLNQQKIDLPNKFFSFNYVSLESLFELTKILWIFFQFQQKHFALSTKTELLIKISL